MALSSQMPTQVARCLDRRSTPKSAFGVFPPSRSIPRAWLVLESHRRDLFACQKTRRLLVCQTPTFWESCACSNALFSHGDTLLGTQSYPYQLHLTMSQDLESSPRILAATKLRKALDGDDIIVAPGVYDGFSARIALGVGFDALYMVCNKPMCPNLA